jgi:hypothetical protein
MTLPYLQLLHTNATAEVLEAVVYPVRMQLLDFPVRLGANCPILGLERSSKAGCDPIVKHLAFVVQADVLDGCLWWPRYTRRGHCAGRSLCRPGGPRRTSLVEPYIVCNHSWTFYGRALEAF